MSKKKSLNIFYGLDQPFVIPFTVSLTSLLENNKNLKVRVYVIHNLEDAQLLHRISCFFLEKYQTKIDFIYFSNDLINRYPTSQVISQASYFRLFLGELIPGEVSRGLYIDCDTIVTESLETLMNFDFSIGEKGTCYLCAVSDRHEEEEAQRISQLGFKSSFYFNAGVMWINLKKWKTDNITERLISLGNDNIAGIKYHDQDILNMTFINNWKRLPETYNNTEREKTAPLPYIIHFSGKSKPWHYIDNDPFKYIYKGYFQMSPFRDEKTEKINIKKVYRKYLNLLKKTIGVKSFSKAIRSTSNIVL